MCQSTALLCRLVIMESPCFYFCINGLKFGVVFNLQDLLLRQSTVDWSSNIPNYDFIAISHVLHYYQKGCFIDYYIMTDQSGVLVIAILRYKLQCHAYSVASAIQSLVSKSIGRYSASLIQLIGINRLSSNSALNRLMGGLEQQQLRRRGYVAEIN